MRLWSVHPKYLDTKGLGALWRESLLAKSVLEGKTESYKNHPQLHRFKKLSNPVDAINQYLLGVHEESARRGYNYNKNLMDTRFKKIRIPLTTGQLNYERTHLLKKLKIRDKEKYKQTKMIKVWEVHPMFKIIDGDIEDWEVSARK